MPRDEWSGVLELTHSRIAWPYADPHEEHVALSDFIRYMSLATPIQDFVTARKKRDVSMGISRHFTRV